MLRYPNFFLLLCLLCCGHIGFCGDLYLNLIWHQHQPLYTNPETDQLQGPWVRTHATKDYYDMAAMHKDYPEIHATINLTSSLLSQLQTYYVDRLSPFLYFAADKHYAIQADSFLAKWTGKTDPWIDLALKPSSEFNKEDLDYLLYNSWNAFGISEIQISHFPEYKTLRDKPRETLTTEDYTAIKAWFYLAHFDPSFLRGLNPIGISLEDLVREENGNFLLNRPLTERDANRLVAEALRVMKEIVPVHKSLLYDPLTHQGQLDIITTPFYHPILPLLIDSKIAKTCQPNDKLPKRFSFPQDADAQVIKSVGYYTNTFGTAPRGFWPAEGSISEEAADVFAKNKIQWFCGDMRVLEKSTPPNLQIAQPYRLKTKHDEIAVVFRETTLSDHIGFTYQKMDPKAASKHFIAEVLKYKPKPEESDRLLTVILDGENAWEWYEQDMDGKMFLHLLYSELVAARRAKTITCVNPTEYFNGNPKRDIPAHPISSFTKIEKLWPGSWINANYDTWIGETEENKGWEYLLKTRNDLKKSGLKRPNPELPPPANEKDLAAWQAYESIYAAEGSDWFWWYGADQSAPAGDKPFEDAFFSHLRAVYKHMNDAGVKIKAPEFKPILSKEKIKMQQSGGAMAKSEAKLIPVLFTCNATVQKVVTAIYIVGNLPSIGEWNPNTVRLYDDGTHGDKTPRDKIWSLEVLMPHGSEIQYKYTNSGQKGVWIPSEEFPSSNRSFTVDETADGKIIRKDIFGRFE